MPVGGLANYPSLNNIANLVRSIVGDDKPGATGIPGEGQILTNASVTLQNFMNSAIRDLYRDVRIMGQPTLIKDNYIVLGVPPVNSSLGVGVMNPAVQVALQYTGFFDGLQMWPNLTLPQDMILPLEVWERQSGTQFPFSQMVQSKSALYPQNQAQWMGNWEWRTDAIWMPGATLSVDLRLRYICSFADLAAPGIDWTQTFVPILDCSEAVAYKTALMVPGRLGGGSLEYAMMMEQKATFKLRQQVTRQRQYVDYQRPVYGTGAGSAGDPARYLY